jgi:hypothetical protein
VTRIGPPLPTNLPAGLAIAYDWADTLAAAGWKVWQPRPFGPCGITVEVNAATRPGRVIVTQADHDDGAEWLHASVAFGTTPTYDDLTVLHRAVFGRSRWSYQVFAPAADHVNLHDHALHLWGRADGEPALPNFGQLGTI